LLGGRERKKPGAIPSQLYCKKGGKGKSTSLQKKRKRTRTQRGNLIFFLGQRMKESNYFRNEKGVVPVILGSCTFEKEKKRTGNGKKKKGGMKGGERGGPFSFLKGMVSERERERCNSTPPGNRSYLPKIPTPPGGGRGLTRAGYRS